MSLFGPRHTIVTDVCNCGASLTYSCPIPSFVDDQVTKFRANHDMCRLKIQVDEFYKLLRSMTKNPDLLKAIDDDEAAETAKRTTRKRSYFDVIREMTTDPTLLEAVNQAELKMQRERA